jgi:hypothetical protein
MNHREFNRSIRLQQGLLNQSSEVFMQHARPYRKFDDNERLGVSIPELNAVYMRHDMTLARLGYGSEASEGVNNPDEWVIRVTPVIGNKRTAVEGRDKLIELLNADGFKDTTPTKTK